MGTVLMLGALLVMPPLLVAILVGALTPNRRGAIPNSILAVGVASVVVFVALIGRSEIESLIFAVLGVVVG